MIRLASAVTAVLLLLSALTGCGKQSGKDAAESFRERYNALVENLGYTDYAADEADFTVTPEGFTALLVGGLIRAEAAADGNRISSLSLSFTDGMLAYLDTLDNKEEATVNGLYLEALGALALSDRWETLDAEDVQAFVSDTLVPAIGEVQKMDDYKIHVTFTVTTGACTVRLDRLK